MKLLVHGKAKPLNRFITAKMLLVMKLTAIFLLSAALHVSAAGFSQTITISKKNASLEEMFEVLQKQGGYNFIINSHMLAKAKKIDIDVQDATVENVLVICFSNQPLTYVIRDKTIIVKEKEQKKEKRIADVADIPAVPPQRIRGIVRDGNNKPIEGAAVSIKKISTGTTTNSEGKFELTIPEGTYEMEISFVGYGTVQKTIKIGSEPPADISITLQIVSTGLTDVVVVGYGTQKKRDITGTISRVKGDDIKNLPVSNAAQALQGRASGVDIVRDDGAPGAAYTIRIRGTGTINNSDPLIVVDGVPLGGLNDFNSNDIASIEILKDASASAIYGSRAANGVVLFTTKKGSFNEPLKATVNLYTGSNSSMKYLKMLTAPDLVKLKQEAYTNDGLGIPTVWSDPYYATQRTDWQKALMGNTGHAQNADVALHGGSANSAYYLSGNYYDEKGIITNSFFRRYCFRINSEHKIGSRLRIGENIAYSNTNSASPDTKSTQAGLVWSDLRFNPAIPVVNPDGSWGTSQADNQLGDINNPVATANEIQKYYKTDRILANAYAELEIIKGLKLRANYGFDHSINDSYEFDNAMPNQTRGPSVASLNQSFYKSKSFLEEYYINYNKKFAEHDVTVTAGYSAQKYDGNFFGASRNGFADTSFDQRVLNLGNSSSVGNYGANYANSGLQSYFVRANYAFSGKYLLTATMRADGSSKFAPGKRWGYFPAFSAGWRVSDEKFFKDNVKAINILKITGGWGQLGNQNVGDFQYLGIIGYGAGGGTGGGGYSYNLGTGTVNQNGAYVVSLANPNITWERAVMTNISLELGLFKNHLNAIFTYYNKNTSDMLVPYQLVETFGAQRNLPDDPGNITLPDQNIGKLNNHGIEIDLNYENSIGKINYSIGANGAFMRNKVTKLYGDKTYLASTPYGRENTDISRTYEGQPIASFFGFKTAGLYQSQTEIDNDPNIASDPNKGNIKPGDVRFLDISGPAGKSDGVIDDKDRTYLGDPNPKFVFGFHGSVEYKGFDFRFNVSGAAGFKLYNADRLAGLDGTQVFNWYAEQLNRWHGQGTSNSVPRLSIDNLNANYRSSDLWVQNGSYVSLKSVSLGYTLSRKTIYNLHLPEIRIYVSSYNLFFITGYKGYTPELGYTNGNLQRGVDVAQYPQNRNLTIGATINF